MNDLTMKESASTLVVLVDGASFSYMQESLNVKINLRSLLMYLSYKKILIDAFWFSARWPGSPFDKIEENLRRWGFKPIHRETELFPDGQPKTGNVDELLIEKIKELIVLQNRVNEETIITNDTKLIREQVLPLILNTGIVITNIGTLKKGEGVKSRSSDSVIDLMFENPHFRFIRLEDLIARRLIDVYNP